MPRYIDAEALAGEMDAGCIPIVEKGISGVTGDETCIMDYINNAPTADVEPVRHGRWIDIGNSDETEGMRECTECGYQTHHEFAIIDEIQECGSMIYCEHCGAKMDGESEERK